MNFSARAIRRAATAAAVVALTGLTIGLTTGSAATAAEPGRDFHPDKANINIYATPQENRDTIVGLGQPGHGIEQLGGQAENPAPNHCGNTWWNQIRDQATGKEGWVPQCDINFLPYPGPLN